MILNFLKLIKQLTKSELEVDPEAELIFGAIKDESMNGKLRVSIVATALHGSNSYNQDQKPYLNLVNSTNVRNNNSDSLFQNMNLENNVANSIDGATALKLDEKYEIKNQNQNALNSFEKNIHFSNNTNENGIPSGVSIESASYIGKR